MVLNFFIPLTIVIAYSAMLGLIGLPISLVCLPQEQRWLAVPLSPLVAIALISCAYEYNFFLLLQPYRPLLVHAVIIVLSLAVLFAALRLRGERLPALLTDTLRGWVRVWPFMVVPLLAIVLFSGFFIVNGLGMLSAGEDEFAYVEVARHIMEHLFTRDALDFPWARADHYLDDYMAHEAAYYPGDRLGAFFLLADMSRIFHLSLEKTFPLLIGVGIFIGTASLALLELLVRRSRLAIVAAQVMFATSFLLVMLHFQGSLSHICTMGIRLGGLAFTIWSVVCTRKIAPLILAGVLGAGWLVLYYESIGFGLALPLLACMALAFFQAARQRSSAPLLIAARSIAVIAITYALQPELFEIAVSLYKFFLINFDAGTNILHLADVNYFAALTRANTVAAHFFAPILGYYSLYDNSAINIHIASALNSYSLIIFLSLAGIAALGFWRRLPAVAGEAWAAVPLALAAVTFLMASREDTNIAIRSAQFLMPHIFIGLSLLVFASRSAVDIKNRLSLAGRIAVGILCAIVVGLNTFAVARTLYHVSRFTDLTDTMVKHFDPDSQRWASLRELVTQTDGAPVLLSGFRDTPTTHMIALGLRSVPTLLGRTITSYWTGIDPSVSVHRDFHLYRHWLSNDELLKRIKADPVWNWPLSYATLLARTRQAIVPASGTYPPEWSDWPSLFGARGWRFPNLCDVLARDDPAFIVGAEHPASGHDEIGSYWLLDNPIAVKPRLQDRVSAVVEVRYTGPVPRITIDGVEANLVPQNRRGIKSTIVEANAQLGPNSVIEISASSDTRTRSVELYRLPAVN
jgi:hypothetical protein